MSQILNPGQYFIELEFDRMVDPAILHRALTNMGFGIVVFDQSLPAASPASVGGAYTSSLAANKLGTVASMVSASKGGASLSNSKPPPAPPPGTQGTSAPPKPAAAPTPAKATPSASAALTSARTTMVVQSRYAPKVTAVAVADGGGPAALKTSTMAKGPTAVGPSKPYAPSASQTGPATGPASPASDTPTEPAFPGEVPAEAGPGPEKAPFVAPTGPSSTTETVEDPIGPPEESAPLAAPSAEQPPITASQAEVAIRRKITDLWTRWKEWGSPFAEGPGMGPKVSGGDEDDPLRFRILARLDRPIALDDRPGMRWLFVKALSFPFFSDLAFQGQPHALRQGSLYELRFLSRAKSNPTRESVKETLTAMGFSPVKLLAFKRNMKLPNRPASLTLWYGMGVWVKADSVIIHDDPFFFETVREIKTRQQMGR